MRRAIERIVAGLALMLFAAAFFIGAWVIGWQIWEVLATWYAQI